MITHRRRLGALLVAAATAALAACSVSITTNPLLDDRTYRDARARGTIAVIGDSVGYGLTLSGNLAQHLFDAGWGPVRTRAVKGLHAAPEGPDDTNTVGHRLAEVRAEGLDPRVVVVVSGSNDVGYWRAEDPARNAQRIDTAMDAIGAVQVVWLTIHHHDQVRMDAWNAALAQVASRRANLHLCDWAGLARANPGLLERDRVHPTVGATGGYAAMRDLVLGCVDAVAPPG